ncbi:MAG: polysaccharide deacetylase family protein [Rhodospirillales bacterium]|nr:polysaccharide deacetylase family protein [Alphaproteobacteria bacterium]USO03528.1 MAG: polysaccharide deacetylase family protein [Rhodospirillales bacterium]
MVAFFQKCVLTAGFLLAVAFPPVPAKAEAEAAAAPPTGYDSSSAVVFAYGQIGEDDAPASSLRLEQFTAHIHELVEDAYTVKPLPEILQAVTSGKPLPGKTVALTFDGADASFLRYAAGLLEERRLPYTLFIPAGQIGEETGRTVGWKDLRRLQKTGLATIGLHTASYAHLAQASEEELKRQINTARALYRENLGTEPLFFAYPFGEFSPVFKEIVRAQGFAAAFGQHSGVVHASDDLFALPRFTMSENYGSLERFQMTARALPLPVSDLQPAAPLVQSAAPAIGFTVDEALAPSLKSLSCFVSGQEKPDIELLDEGRVEVRLKEPLTQERTRMNCTLPGPADTQDALPRWRWLGMLLLPPGDAIPAAPR